MTDTDAVSHLAEELPEYQSSRGDEFRELEPEDCTRLARMLVLSRSQVAADNADFDDHLFRRSLRDKKERYVYEAGRLGISMRETIIIWRNVVYGDSVPPSQMSYHI